ncbi:MAG: pimeloyl-ACP methyl ester carboxylesterase [Neolewinella sp.]|jgi:pimeloyl-ACP methyl ester carboxylesterase
MKWIKRLSIFLGCLYLLICGLLFFYQDALIFHPRARAWDHSYGNYEEDWVSLTDGTRLNALRIKAKAGNGQGVVLYLHGNVGDNGRSIYQTRTLQGLSYDLYLVDYRGFGKSESIVDGEEDMTEDFQLVYDRLVGEYGEENIILAGYSLGTGPASFLAANNEPKGVVLIAPYTSLVDMKNEFFWMFPDFLMKYELNNLRYLQASKSPVTILHGTADKLIPFRMGEQLAAIDAGRMKLVALQETGHRGAVLHAQFGKAVAALIAGK